MLCPLSALQSSVAIGFSLYIGASYVDERRRNRPRGVAGIAVAECKLAKCATSAYLRSGDGALYSVSLLKWACCRERALASAASSHLWRRRKAWLAVCSESSQAVAHGGILAAINARANVILTVLRLSMHILLKIGIYNMYNMKIMREKPCSTPAAKVAVDITRRRASA